MWDAYNWSSNRQQVVWWSSEETWNSESQQSFKLIYLLSALSCKISSTLHKVNIETVLLHCTYVCIYISTYLRTSWPITFINTNNYMRSNWITENDSSVLYQRQLVLLDNIIFWIIYTSLPCVPSKTRLLQWQNTSLFFPAFPTFEFLNCFHRVYPSWWFEGEVDW